MSDIARRRFLQATAIGGAASVGLLPSAQAQTAATPAALNVAGPGTPLPAFKAPDVVRPLHLADLNDLEAAAKAVMDPGAFAYIASGADNQWTLRRNRSAFDDYALKPQYLVGKTAPDLRTELLGQQLAMPIITTPMGAHGLAHQSAELGTARGAGESGSLLTVSTAANTSLEDIAAATRGPKWFQLYLEEDGGVSRALMQRAEAAGYSAIVFTVDAFAPGSSDETIRLNFSFPKTLPLINTKGGGNFKKSLSWADVEFVQKNTKLPVILKGILTPELAKRAVSAGVAGIQVSNHGGRQLDGVPAAIEALPAVAKAVGGKVPIIMDSGIRRGNDVFKALALGANAVAIGRPVLYGLSLGGWMGVQSVYSRLKAELTRSMLIAGVSSIKEINSGYLIKRDA